MEVNAGLYNSLHITGYIIQIINYGLQVTLNMLHVTGYILYVACYMLHYTYYRLQVTCCMLHVTCYMLHVINATTASGYIQEFSDYILHIIGCIM